MIIDPEPRYNCGYGEQTYQHNRGYGSPGFKIRGHFGLEVFLLEFWVITAVSTVESPLKSCISLCLIVPLKDASFHPSYAMPIVIYDTFYLHTSITKFEAKMASKFDAILASKFSVWILSHNRGFTYPIHSKTMHIASPCHALRLCTVSARQSYANPDL